MTSNLARKMRQEIEGKFRPLFQQKEVESGIPLVELRTTLKGSNLPEPKIQRFLYSADQDQNKLITYNEFYDQIMKEDEETLQQLSKSKRFIYNVVKTVAPYKKKDIQVRSGDNVDYANWGEEDVKRYSDAYSCKPPPFMIPLITLVEIYENMFVKAVCNVSLLL